ncbi:MAG TPA: cupin domain-containing protein [Planctomycetes bacterium]|nr:cupin domain-containing protein [Planctomycetota bacterium]
MLIKNLKDCPEFTAGDDSLLRELFHPDKADLDIPYSLAHATVHPKRKTIPHRLKASEVYYIIQGKGIMHINDESAEVTAPSAVYIPPNSTQYIENTGTSDLKFLCIVDPAWRSELEQILH